MVRVGLGRKEGEKEHVSAPREVLVHCDGLEDVTHTDVTILTEETTQPGQ